MLDSLRSYCLAKPGVTEDTPFGDDVLVFRVGGKIFALLNLDGPPFRVNLKCEPEAAVEYRERYEDVRPGYHMNKKHWNTVALGGDVPVAVLREMVDHSYERVIEGLPARVRAGLQPTSPTAE